MKTTVMATGLDCASCAAKIEQGVAALPGVTGCRLNFLTGKLIIEAEDGRMSDVLEAARKLARKVEPGVKLIHSVSNEG